jgi:hypothetical protein
MVGDRARLGRTGRAGTLAGLLVLTLAAVLLFLLSGCSAETGARALSGDIAVHDPAYVAGSGDGASYVYSTGNGDVADGNIQIRSSVDGLAWEYVGEVWQEKPDWLVEAVPGVDNLWAPELYEHDGTWYLYYSASLFGTNTSVIALATNSTLDPDAAGYEWVDQGEVITSVGTDYNSIDPGVVEDADAELRVVLERVAPGRAGVAERAAHRRRRAGADRGPRPGRERARGAVPARARRLLLPVLLAGLLLPWHRQHLQHRRRPVGNRGRAVPRRQRRGSAG